MAKNKPPVRDTPAPARPACRILTIAEAAAITGWHRSTIERYIKYGSLPALRNNSRLMGIREDDLAEWLESKRETNITEVDFEFS